MGDGGRQTISDATNDKVYISPNSIRIKQDAIGQMVLVKGIK
jgi:hypothetical protein